VISVVPQARDEFGALVLEDRPETDFLSLDKRDKIG
jgi:hypothetical protein